MSFSMTHSVNEFYKDLIDLQMSFNKNSPKSPLKHLYTKLKTGDKDAMSGGTVYVPVPGPHGVGILPATVATTEKSVTQAEFDAIEAENAARNAERSRHDEYYSMADPLVYGSSAASRLVEMDKLLQGNSFWDSLTSSQKIALSSNYINSASGVNSLWGLLPSDVTNSIDVNRMVSDIQELSSIEPFNLEAPTYSAIEDEIAKELEPHYARARDRALDSYNYTNQVLDDNLALAQQSFNEQFANMNDLYNRSASNMLSNQYLANAQTFDVMQSDMRKSRQNALEAGASAGLRLAGNVNALLTAQNKQSATAMDTSNALAEMLLQQRNAASGLRSDYNNYMANTNTAKANNKTQYNSALTGIDTDYRSELSDRTNTKFEREMADYNAAEQKYSTQFTNAYNRGNSIAPAYETHMYRNQNK